MSVAAFQPGAGGDVLASIRQMIAQDASGAVEPATLRLRASDAVDDTPLSGAEARAAALRWVMRDAVRAEVAPLVGGEDELQKASEAPFGSDYLGRDSNPAASISADHQKTGPDSSVAGGEEDFGQLCSGIIRDAVRREVSGIGADRLRAMILREVANALIDERPKNSR